VQRSHLVLLISGLLFLAGALSTVLYFSGQEPVEHPTPLPSPREVAQRIQRELDSLDYALPVLPLAYLHRGKLKVGVLDFNGNYHELANLPAEAVVPLPVERPCCNRQLLLLPLRSRSRSGDKGEADGLRFLLVNLLQRRVLLSAPLGETEPGEIELIAPYPDGVILRTRRGWLRWNEGMNRWERLPLPAAARPLYWGDRLTIVHRGRVIYPPAMEKLARELKLPPQTWMVLTARRGVAFADRSGRLLGVRGMKEIADRLPARPELRRRVRLVPTTDGRLGAVVVGLRVHHLVGGNPDWKFFLPTTIPLTLPPNRLWAIRHGLLLVRRRQADLINPLGKYQARFHLPVGADEIVLP